MKYSITIDTNGNEITVDIVCPRFLRTGSETQEELERRRNCIGEWARAKTPDWLQDTVDYLQDRSALDMTVSNRKTSESRLPPPVLIDGGADSCSLKKHLSHEYFPQGQPTSL